MQLYQMEPPGIVVEPCEEEDCWRWSYTVLIVAAFFGGYIVMCERADRRNRGRSVSPEPPTEPPDVDMPLY